MQVSHQSDFLRSLARTQGQIPWLSTFPLTTWIKVVVTYFFEWLVLNWYPVHPLPLSRTSKRPRHLCHSAFCPQCLTQQIAKLRRKRVFRRTWGAEPCGGETMGSVRTWQRSTAEERGCYIWKQIIIPAQDFEWYLDILEKDVSQDHHYRIRLHLRAVTLAPVWWLDSGGQSQAVVQCRDEH